MTKDEKKAFRFCRRIYLIVLIVAIVAIYLCSCTKHDYCNKHFETGVVEQVERSHAYAKKYKVCVKERSMSVASKFNYYWLYTDDLLQVGDTIHIGKN